MCCGADPYPCQALQRIAQNNKTAATRQATCHVVADVLESHFSRRKGDRDLFGCRLQPFAFLFLFLFLSFDFSFQFSRYILFDICEPSSSHNDPNMLNWQLLLLLAWYSLRVCCQTPLCNPNSTQLPEMWAGYTSQCTFYCHLDTWKSSSCSLADINCGCGSCLAFDNDCLCVTRSWVLTVFGCIGRYCTESEQQDAADVASGCSSSGEEVGDQVNNWVSMAYAAGMILEQSAITSSLTP